MFKGKFIFLVFSAPNPDNIGQQLYDKALWFGKWAAILSLAFVAFLFFLNKQERAGEHFKSVIKGVFTLVLAPTIIGVIWWIASGISL